MKNPICILVAAMGGEGGGVLAEWLIHAAQRADFPVQSTSVPGVAQRTGATTYYIEIFPEPRSSLGRRQPVLSLTPTPGHLDVVAASELMEAGRAIQGGFVHPGRTELIASTHREYAVSEKVAMGDGRFDGDLVVQAANARARRALLVDMKALALRHGTIINTVLFGAMAGAGVLPFPRAVCEEAIRHSGKAVEASLRGFAAGFDAALGRTEAADHLERSMRPAAAQHPRVRALPPALREVVCAGVELTTDYQDVRYAEQYLDAVEGMLRLEQHSGRAGVEVTRETARYLALWMCYEDVIRVAQLKTRRERLERVRREVGAKWGQPLRLTEYLKPGLDEIASVLPPAAAAWLRRLTEGRSWYRGMHLRTDTARGFLMLCGLRSLRPLRRKTSRYAEEHAAMRRWLDAIEHALPGDAALELALCGNLVKGYGQTSRRGHLNLAAILTLAEQGARADRLQAARKIALSDPEGHKLQGGVREPIAQPIRFVKRRPAN